MFKIENKIVIVIFIIITILTTYGGKVLAQDIVVSNPTSTLERVDNKSFIYFNNNYYLYSHYNSPYSPTIKYSILDKNFTTVSEGTFNASVNSGGGLYNITLVNYNGILKYVASVYQAGVNGTIGANHASNLNDFSMGWTSGTSNPDMVILNGYRVVFNNNGDGYTTTMPSILAANTQKLFYNYPYGTPSWRAFTYDNSTAYALMEGNEFVKVTVDTNGNASIVENPPGMPNVSGIKVNSIQLDSNKVFHYMPNYRTYATSLGASIDLNPTFASSSSVLDYALNISPKYAIATILYNDKKTIDYRIIDINSKQIVKSGTYSLSTDRSNILSLRGISDASETVFAINGTSSYTPVLFKVLLNSNPTISLSSPGSNQTINASGTVTISGTVTDPDAGQTDTISATINGVTKSTTVATPASNAAWSLSWPGSGIAEGSYTNISVTANDGNGGTGSTTYTGTITVDKTPPTVSIGSPSGTVTKSGPITYTVTYSGANTANLTNANVTLNKTGTANGTINVTNGTTNMPTVTISGITGDGTLGITIASGTATDTAGNTAAGAGPSTTFTVSSSATYTTPPLPNGFTYITGTWDTGYVIQDSYGNQWVWVPVGGIRGGFTRRDLGTAIGSLTVAQTSDPVPYSVTIAITNTGGFYVARYEMSNNGGKAQSKAGQTVWNYMDYTTAYSKGASMSTDYSYPSTLSTHLIYDTEWDTIMQWMKDSGINVDSDSNSWGNYYNDPPTGNNGLMSTAGNVAFQNKNIYDMAGNVQEWTQGVYLPSYLTTYRLLRGGFYLSSGNSNPAAYRSCNVPSLGDVTFGWRAAFVVLSTAPPLAPTGLTATAASSSQINLSWTAVTGATSYKIYRGGVLISSPTTTSFSDTGLAAGTSYSYYVKASNAGGDSVASSTASATTIPAAPTNLTTAATGSKEIDLAWTGSTGAKGYDVYRATGSSAAGAVKIMTVTGTSYNDTGLAVKTTYTYYIIATNTSGSSVQSSPATATTTGIIPVLSNLTVTGSGFYGDNVSLSASYTNISQAAYRIFYTTSTTVPTVGTGSNPGTGWTDAHPEWTNGAHMNINGTTSVSQTVLGTEFINTTWTYVVFKIAASSTTSDWAWSYTPVYGLKIDPSSVVDSAVDKFFTYVGHNQIIPANSSNSVVVSGPDTPVQEYGPYNSTSLTNLNSGSIFINRDILKYRLEFYVTDVQKIGDLRALLNFNSLNEDGIQLQLNTINLQQWLPDASAPNGYSFKIIKDLSNAVKTIAKNKYDVSVGLDNSNNPILLSNGLGKYAIEYSGTLVTQPSPNNTNITMRNEAEIRVYSTTGSYIGTLNPDLLRNKFYIDTKVSRLTTQYR